MRAPCGQFTYDNACIGLTGLMQYILSLPGYLKEVRLEFIVDGDPRGSGTLRSIATAGLVSHTSAAVVNASPSALVLSEQDAA